MKRKVIDIQNFISFYLHFQYSLQCLNNNRTWSSGRSVSDGWPDSTPDSENKDWPSSQQSPASAFTDLVPEFEPGKPWKVRNYFYSKPVFLSYLDLLKCFMWFSIVNLKKEICLSFMTQKKNCPYLMFRDLK